MVCGRLRSATRDREQRTLTAARDFSLNTEGWFHTNHDPRQYISYDAQRAAAIAGLTQRSRRPVEGAHHRL